MVPERKNVNQYIYDMVLSGDRRRWVGLYLLSWLAPVLQDHSWW